MNHFTITGFADEISECLEEQITELKQLGITHIELRGIDGRNVSELSLKEAKSYKLKLDQAGISVSSIGSPIGKIGIDEVFDSHLNLFRHILQVARVFESPYIRMFSFYIADGQNNDDYQEAVLERWQLFLEAAADYPEIILLHENEKGIYGDTPERCQKLLSALNSAKVQAAFDPANFVQCQVKVFPDAYETLKEYIGYVHIKDAKSSTHEICLPGVGAGAIVEILKQLMVDDFVGFLSLEPHLSNFSGFSALEITEETTLKDGDNQATFRLASAFFKEIIVEQLGQTWQ